ncbi:Chorismate synthase 1 chloroplastic [Bienertia sinuspersici]
MASSLSTKPFLGSASSNASSALGSAHSGLSKLASPCQISFRRQPRKLVFIHPSILHHTSQKFKLLEVHMETISVLQHMENHMVGGVGCVVDGCPPRLPLSEEDLQLDLDRRRPGQSRITTPRKETDTCKIISGVAEGVTTGSPIAVNVPNTDQRGHDYSEMSKAYRPSHADATYDFKYGVRSIQGGGRSSARETIGRVAAGAIAKKILKKTYHVFAYVSQVHKVVLPEGLVNHETLTLEQNQVSNHVADNLGAASASAYFFIVSKNYAMGRNLSARHQITKILTVLFLLFFHPPMGLVLGNTVYLVKVALNVKSLPIINDKVSLCFKSYQIESNIVRCPDPEYAEKMIEAIDAVRIKGDSVGGVVTCIVKNAPRGLGSPVFDKLEAELAKAALSLPATKGFELGSGFAGTLMTGSEHNDEFYMDDQGRIRTKTNRSGGIQGGISNGETIYMRIGFKPTSTIGKKQHTVTRGKEETDLIARGRHDPCVVPRAVPMVEAMVALVLVDQLMSQYAQCELFAINPSLQEPLELPRLDEASV